MAELTIVDWDEIKDEFIGRTVGQLEKVDVASATVRMPPRLTIKDVGVSFAGSAKLSISAYNDPLDVDDENVVGVSAGTVVPKIAYAPENAWLRYSLVGELTADARAKLAIAGVKVAASSQVIFSDYRMHPPSDAAVDHVLADLGSARTALNVDQVCRLAAGDALYYEVRGDVLFSVSVGWADIYSKTLREICAALPCSRLLAIDLEVGATAGFDITATDDFVLVFWRDAAGTLRAGVRKAASRGTAFSAGVAVTARLHDRGEIARAARAIVDGYFGFDVDAVEAVLTKATGGTLSRGEKEIFDAVVQALGLDPLVATLKQVRDALERMQEDVRARLESAAETAIAASWKYDYARVESTQCIVEAPLAESQLRALHDSLIAQDIRPLLDSAAAGEIALSRYLDETTVVRSSSHGFSLGIGKWFRIGDHDREKLTVRTRRSFDKKRSMVTAIGSRRFGGDGSWSIGQYDFDFRAEMSDYRAEPKTSDFEFGLSCSMKDAECRIGGEAIERILDTASMWGIVPLARIDEARQRLRRLAGCRASARYRLTFSEELLRLIAPVAAVRDDAQMGFALGAAMPWYDRPARRSWQTRALLYGSPWHAVLHDQAAFRDAFALASPALERIDGAMINVDESDQAGGLRRMIERHPQLVWHYTSWVAGNDLLDAALNDALGSKTIEMIFGSLYDFFSQVLYVRAIGRRMMEIAESRACADDVARVLTVDYEDEQKRPRSLTIGAKY